VIGETITTGTSHVRRNDGLTTRALDTEPGMFAEAHAGDACSALGILGAATILASWPFGKSEPRIERWGRMLVLGSMGAALVDTAIQGHNMVEGQGKRSKHAVGLGPTAYAATGLIPAASLMAVRSVRHRMSLSGAARVGVLGLATGVMGYELTHRSPRIASGEESWSGYGSFVAAAAGFVVARHAVRIRPTVLAHDLNNVVKRVMPGKHQAGG
jgi:hypothetical protein